MRGYVFPALSGGGSRYIRAYIYPLGLAWLWYIHSISEADSRYKHKVRQVLLLLCCGIAILAHYNYIYIIIYK